MQSESNAGRGQQDQWFSYCNVREFEERCITEPSLITTFSYTMQGSK